SKSSRERSVALAMVAARVVAPQTKLATTRWWHTPTLAEDFGVRRCDGSRSLRGNGLVARAPVSHREEARRPSSAGRELGAVRLVLKLLRGHELSVGEARLQSRWAPGEAAGQLWSADRCAGMSCCRLGLRR